MKYRNLGHRIASLRKERALTQEDLAKKIGLSRPVMVKIENAQRVVSVDEGTIISSALGISINTLINYEKSESDENSFVKAFKSKGQCSLKQEKEIIRFELLFDALCTQEKIYKGE